MTDKKAGRPKIYKVAVADKIYDGEGGFLKVGDTLPEGADIASLEAKGLVK